MSSDKAARDDAAPAQAIAKRVTLLSRLAWVRLALSGLRSSGLVLSGLVLSGLVLSGLVLSGLVFSERSTERGRVADTDRATPAADAPPTARLPLVPPVPPHRRPATPAATGDDDPTLYEIEPQLVPPSDPCYDQWSEVLGEPSREEDAWRRKLNHGIYRVAIAGTPLARVELLSSASPALCDGDPDWTMRQTQVLITYYLSDGDTKELLYEFVEDDVFYDHAPRIDARGGIIVLRGVQFDGSRIRITLQLELLRELYDAVVPRSQEPPDGLLTAGHTRGRKLAIG